MNIYKLALFIVLLNLAIGIYTAGAVENQIYNDNIYSATQTHLLNSEEELITDESSNSLTDQFELTVGSGVKWTRVLKNIFLGTLNPFSLSTSDFTEALGIALVTLLGFFRSIVGIYIVIKIINVIKNKDTN